MKSKLSTGWGRGGLTQTLEREHQLAGDQVLEKLAAESEETGHPSVYVCVYMCGALAGKYLAALLVVLGLSKCSGKGMLAGQWQEVATSPRGCHLSQGWPPIAGVAFPLHGWHLTQRLPPNPEVATHARGGHLTQVSVLQKLEPQRSRRGDPQDHTQ